MLSLLIALLLQLVPDTGEVLLEWHPNPEPDIGGYRVYWGTQTNVYDHVLDAGNRTDIVLSDLPIGPTYYCVLTAYNTLGLESGFSRELAWEFVPAEMPAPKNLKIAFP